MVIAPRAAVTVNENYLRCLAMRHPLRLDTMVLPCSRRPHTTPWVRAQWSAWYRAWCGAPTSPSPLTAARSSVGSAPCSTEPHDNGGYLDGKPHWRSSRLSMSASCMWI